MQVVNVQLCRQIRFPSLKSQKTWCRGLDAVYLIYICHICSTDASDYPYKIMTEYSMTVFWNNKGWTNKDILIIIVRCKERETWYIPPLKTKNPWISMTWGSTHLFSSWQHQTIFFLLKEKKKKETHTPHYNILISCIIFFCDGLGFKQ